MTRKWNETVLVVQKGLAHHSCWAWWSNCRGASVALDASRCFRGVHTSLAFIGCPFCYWCHHIVLPFWKSRAETPSRSFFYKLQVEAVAGSAVEQCIPQYSPRDSRDIPLRYNMIQPPKFGCSHKNKIWPGLDALSTQFDLNRKSLLMPRLELWTWCTLGSNTKTWYHFLIFFGCRGGWRGTNLHLLFQILNNLPLSSNNLPHLAVSPGSQIQGDLPQISHVKELRN